MAENLKEYLRINNLKIAIGYDLKPNSWGGGNQFANSFGK